MGFTKPYWQIDSSGMVIVIDDPDSWRDSIGRNLQAYVAYSDETLVEAVSKCFWGSEMNLINNWQRHPIIKSNDLSRDHISYALILFTICNESNSYCSIGTGILPYHYMLSKLKWRINDHTTLRGMWLWIQVLKDSKWEVPYYMCKIPEMLIHCGKDWLVRKIANVKPERSQVQWDLDITRNRTKLHKIASKLVFPAYALHNMAWQVRILPDCLAKRILQKIMLPMAGKHNYVIKKLLNKVLSQKELQLVNEYQSMTGSRWTTTLDELNDRHVEIIDKERVVENNLDKNYLLSIIFNPLK